MNNNPSYPQGYCDCRMSADGSCVEIRCTFEIGNVFKQPYVGAKWSPVNRCWTMPPTRETLEVLRGIRSATIHADVQDALPPVEPPCDPIPDDLEGIIAQMPVKIRPYAHQAAAFKRAMEVFG